MKKDIAIIGAGQPALRQTDVSRCYVVMDLEAATKDVVWAVCSTRDAAEKSKQSLIDSSVDKSRLVNIVEMEME